VAFSEVYKALAIQDDVFRAVRRNLALKEHLTEIRVIEAGGKKIMNCYVLEDPVELRYGT
jgi:hypothetical protein